MNFDEVKRHLKSDQASPVYLLHGEEPFYIDRLVDFAAENILEESERDFNQTVLYAKETPPINVLDTVTRLPMMAEKQVVILKEAQEWKKASQWEELEAYFESPSPSTIFIIAHKYKNFDGRSKIFKVLSKNAVVFKSEGVRDYQLTTWVQSYVKQQNFNITEKAVALLAEFIGNDLSRIANELEKLMIVIKDGEQINEAHIEEHIGISKEYNVFELTNAVLEMDTLKANKIVHYFGQNPKATHITVVLANLHTLYQRLFKAHFAKTNDPKQLASLLKIHPYPAKELLLHKRKHPAKIISRNFSILREYDLLAKGVGSVRADDKELMREMIFRLMH